MAASRKTSKLARALEKDLQGGQVVYRHFQEGKISILRDSRDRYFTAVSGPWSQKRALKLVAISILVVASGLLYFKQEESEKREPVNVNRMTSVTSMTAKASQGIRQTFQKNTPHLSGMPSGKTETHISQVQGVANASPCMLKKSSYGTAQFSFDRELRFARKCLGVTGGSIYCWNDRQGITHFSTTGFPEKEYFSPNWVKY